MNSIEYINQLIQAVNSINGHMFSLRNELEQIKKDFVEMKERVVDTNKKETVDENNKKHEEQVQVIVESMNKTKVMMEEMQNKLGSVDELYKRVAVDGDLDYFKVLSKETAEKLKNLEIALTLKANTLERGIKNIPKSITKDDVQSMIDKSINMLLRPSAQEETSGDVHQEVVDAQEVVDVISSDPEVDIDVEVDETPIEVVIESVEPVAQAKPKRKYNKKK
jgi:hypothetical protein